MAISISKALEVTRGELEFTVVEQRNVAIRNRFDVASKLDDQIIEVAKPLIEGWRPLVHGCGDMIIPNSLFRQAVDLVLADIKNGDDDIVLKVIALNSLAAKIIEGCEIGKA